ncbi:MAG: hypothetical protein FWB73_02880 [Treponema sp.]|nr:hypothetical protein [Treponema sp.]
MAEIFWPDALPADFLAEGLTIQPQSNVIRTTMDAGARKTRRRYTANTTKYSGKQRFNEDEFIVFKQFYKTELADGVFRFNYKDPITNEMAEFRFTEDYTAAEVGGIWEVTLPLERL